MKYYSLKKYLKTTFSATNRTENRLVSAVKLFSVAALLAASTSSMQAQVSGTYNFETNLGGWTSVGNEDFEMSNIEACGGGNSARANVYYGSTNLFTSPSLGTSNGGQVTLNFDYKVVEWGALNGAPVDSFGLSAQWSNSVNGPWTNFYTLSPPDHNVSTACASRTATFVPANGDLYVRMTTFAGPGADLFFYFDNISVSQGSAATCASVNNLVIDGTTITSTSFTGTWTAPTVAPALGYEYEVRTSGPAGSGAAGLISGGNVAAGITSVSVSDLTPSNSYTLYVRSKCSATDYSLWSASASVQTLCLPVAIPYEIPFSEAILPSLPPCITKENVNNDGQTWVTAGSIIGMTGNGMKYRYSNTLAANDWFYTAQLELVAGESYRLSFQYRISGYEEKLKVAIGTSPVAIAMTTTLFDVTIPASMGDVVTEIIDFTVPTSGNYNIGFQAHSEAYQNELYVAAVSVGFGTPSACPAPTGLEVQNITTNTAVASWTASATAINGYKYELRTSGAAGSGATGLITAEDLAAGVTTANLAALMPNTTYNFYVASKCGAGANSIWSAATTFTTLCVTPEITADHVQTVTVDALEDATLADLQPAGANIAWYENPGDAIANQNALSLTTQLVSGTTYFAVLNENGCFSMPFDVTVTVALGVSNQIMSGLSYYPNPVQDQLIINYTQDITSVSVFNLVGQKVMSLTPNTSNATIDLSALTTGTYMIQVTADSASKVIKVVKK